jgi:SulP family sulfate permease
VVASPLVGYIPLAALAAVLMVVAWHMTEKEEFWTLIVGSRGDAVVLLATFLLTIFVDLVTGIGAGVVIGSLLFLHRMAETVEIRGGPQFVSEDVADEASKFDPERATARDVMVYKINGAFFFGATARVTQILERLAASPKVFVLDFSDVPLIDSTGAHSLGAFTARLRRHGTAVYFAATRPEVHRMLTQAGLKPPIVKYVAAVSEVKGP